MKNKFTTLSEVLQVKTKNKKYAEAMSRKKVLDLWSEIVESFFASAKQLTKAIDFKKGVIKVACLDKDLAYQIKVLARRIIYALNTGLGKNLVLGLEVEY